MELWQMDIVGRVLLAGGGECKMVTGIDDHSRFMVIAKVVQRATARAVCLAFGEALVGFGVPDEVPPADLIDDLHESRPPVTSPSIPKPAHTSPLDSSFHDERHSLLPRHIARAAMRSVERPTYCLSVNCGSFFWL
jgi:hypothetical protein